MVPNLLGLVVGGKVLLLEVEESHGVNNFGTDENEADPVAVKPRWHPKDGEQIKAVKLALHLSMDKGWESVHLRVSRNRKIVVYGESERANKGKNIEYGQKVMMENTNSLACTRLLKRGN
ncbi:uncharacterized protein HKW66_Vig0149210 [Vigna angularis]|uniref:Uncharacterized protein n=1 Tax=Phaseolus angularis TaxID=3914 RepID=A0A8T0JV99_PHAAN|nr:uncharacterized protein HKW66_Vig0149210 [Vigna angularis]